MNPTKQMREKAEAKKIARERIRGSGTQTNTSIHDNNTQWRDKMPIITTACKIMPNIWKLLDILKTFRRHGIENVLYLCFPLSFYYLAFVLHQRKSQIISSGNNFCSWYLCDAFINWQSSCQYIWFSWHRKWLSMDTVWALPTITVFPARGSTLWS